LFAVDIAPRQATGAAMGLVGVFSYLGAAIQETVSAGLIGSGVTMVDGVRTYDFHTAILFWIGASVVSLLLAASLWNTKVRD
jgi:OPA family sugar phosphate sensor protein UhpC-like MFS transporter